PAFPGVTVASVGRVEFAVTPAAPNKVWALVSDASSSKMLGLFQWDAATSQWTALAASGVYTNDRRADFGDQGDYDLAIAVDPRDAQRVYVGGVRAYRSTDGGRSFQPMAMEIHCDWHQIVIDPRNPDVLYAGTDGG